MAYDRVTFLKSLSNDVFKAYDEAQWLSQYDALVAKTDMSAAEHYLADMAYSEVYSGYKASHGTKGIGELTPLLKKYETKDAPTSITIRRPQDWAQAGYYHKSGLDTHTLSRVWGLIQATPIGGIEQSIKTLSSEYPLTVAEKIMDAGAYYLAYMDSKEGSVSQEDAFGMIRANDYDAGANVSGDRAKEKAREAYKASSCWPKGDSESPEAVYARVGTRGATGAPVSAATAPAVSWTAVPVANIVVDVTPADFESKVVQQSNTTPVIACFYNPSDSASMAYVAQLEAAVKAKNGSFVLAKVDVTKNPTAGTTYGLTTFPNVISFVKAGRDKEYKGVQDGAGITTILSDTEGRARSQLTATTAAAATTAAPAASNIVALTNAADFQSQVIDRSKTTPVLVYAYDGAADPESIPLVASLEAKVKAKNGNVVLVLIKSDQINNIPALFPKSPVHPSRDLIIYANGMQISDPAETGTMDEILNRYVEAADAAK